MKKDERLNYILEEIRTYNKVKSTDLCSQLNVSEDTIRRDLKELSDKGKIKKVHGGAMASNYIPFSHKEREVYAHTEKVKIVRKARKLLKDDMVISMDGGTTNLEMARLMPQDIHLTVVTNSFPIASQLTEHPHIDILFLGGKVLKSAQVSIGLDVIKPLAQIKTDLCFIGTRSLDLENGLTDIDREEVQVKQMMIESTAKVVCLTLSEKLGTYQPYKICAAGEIDIIITELESNNKVFNAYKQKDIKIL